MTEKKSNNRFNLIMWSLIVVAMAVAIIFCVKKQGYHYDENYSYYSTNVTYGLHVYDREWKPVSEITSEFMALEGEKLNLGVVKLNQSFDVHPPLYYYLLRIVCFLSKNTFSKWQGLFINLVFYFICLLLLWKIADELGEKDKMVTLFTLILFMLSPGYLSTVTFIRMYVMLTAECFALLLLVMKAIKNDKWSTWPVYVLTCLLSFAGFMTHYYFVIFLFFVAAFTCIYLVVRKSTRIKAFIYGFSVCFGLVLAVLYYPSCLSHIFSGYRGVEATEAFADMSNTGSRINFFVQLLNDYTFSGLFYILAMVIILLYVFYSYRKKVSFAGKVSGEVKSEVNEDNIPTAEISEKQVANRKSKVVSGFVIFVTLGYFLLVCKTGMMPSNPPEALRYECPAYGLIILLVVWLIAVVFKNVTKNRKIPMAILAIAVAFQFYGLMSDKVFFIYEDAPKAVEWAAERSDADIVYIYNPQNEWMIWNDSSELMQYEQIYFVDMNNTEMISDDTLQASDHIYVYTCRCDNSETIIQSLVENSESLTDYSKVEERLYVDIYELTGNGEKKTANEITAVVENEDFHYTCEYMGEKRSFFLQLPKETKGADLIVMLHGYGSDGDAFANFTKLHDMAIPKGYAVVYPDGMTDPDDGTASTGWNSGLKETGNDDAGFLSALARYLQNEYLLNRERCVVIGYSNGAYMTHRLAVDEGRVFTDIVCVSGFMPEYAWKNRPDKAKVNVLQISGTKDNVVPQIRTGTDKSSRAPAIETVMEYYAASLGLDKISEEELGGKSIITKYTSETDNHKVWEISVKDGRHSWYEETYCGFDIYEMIFGFLG